jgi:hypothetical protein
MLFAPSNASVVEFGLAPQLNRAFGHMAEALSLDHWIVPNVSAFVYDHYVLSDANIAEIIRLLRFLLEKKGLTSYIQSPASDEL